MHGITAALETLTECTEVQLEKLKSGEKSKVCAMIQRFFFVHSPFIVLLLQVLNRGRVICIGSFRDDGYVRSLESFFQESIIQINQQNFPSNHLPISHCDLVLINIYPNPPTPNIKGKTFCKELKRLKLTSFSCSEHSRLDLSPILSCELISVCASRWLASRLVR